MIYKTEEEKKGVRKAFKKFLVENDLNFSTFMKTYKPNEKYQDVYNKVHLGNVDHDYLEGLAKLINPLAKIEKLHSTWMITVNKYR